MPINLRIENKVKITGRVARMLHLKLIFLCRRESAGLMNTDKFSQQSPCAILTLPHTNFSTGAIMASLPTNSPPPRLPSLVVMIGPKRALNIQRGEN